MAIFNKKTSEGEVENKKASEAKKDVAVVKNKKAVKPKGDTAGYNLTKEPGRIIKTPRITEKALQMTTSGTYVFEVAMDATKRDIVTAVQALYKITPRKINIVRRGPRPYVARFRNRRGTKVGVKKAYVFLKKGDKIDLA
ncbi:MAG: 50S ribosomal protein L23 [Parcubacteria group bacterium GW2011_GWA2_43_11]|nr:MAG: 50S ribosomal protein L23 [Parcubacteria group bacterium GW2011_GWC2_42_11]KKS85978.1 MAG: 50S ribosomal protein L23 [Parcubacteria group bacterium GW2011_GWA2_43_11]